MKIIVRWTDKELQVMRRRVVNEHRLMNAEPPKSITCDQCAAKYDCQYVYDPYNTDGDCLNK